MAGNGASHGPQNVVIAGGGIIGCATAYYLSKLGGGSDSGGEGRGSLRILWQGW